MFRPIKIGDSARAMVMALFFVTATVVSSIAHAQVTVSADVDRELLEPGDSLTLVISVTSSEEVTINGPDLRALSDFEIKGESTQREQNATFSISPNGRPQFQTVQSTYFNYTIEPKRVGRIEIPSLTVVVDGKAYRTQPIKDIEVVAGANAQMRPRSRGQQGNPQPALPPGFDEEDEDLFSQLLRRGMPSGQGSRTLPVNPDEAFFVQVEADKTEAYVGEQITVSWYLYTRGQIRDLDTLKYPSLRGFWKEDIEIATHLNFTQEIVNGIPYKKALLASFALFPIKEGTATIDEYKAKCTVIPGVDAFGMAFGRSYVFTKASQPLKITVKPLPAEGRPADFSGAVGDFQVTARVEDNNVVANQPFTYKIRFEGKGNAKLIDIPPVQPPQDMELYDTQKEAKFFRTGTSYKDFSLLLIPRREGEYTIPPVSVSIFDPQSKRYITKTTEPVRVFVGKGTAPPQGGQSLSLDESAKSEPKKADARPEIQTEFKTYRPFSAAQQTMGFSAIFGLVGLTLLWRARTELGWGQKKKDLMRRLRARLRRVDARIAAGDWRGVGVEMTNTVYFILGEISGEGGANVELEKLLLKAPPSVRRELAEPLTKQMEVFQVLTFAPEGVVGNLKDPERLKVAVTQMSELMAKAVALGLSSGQSGESE